MFSRFRPQPRSILVALAWSAGAVALMGALPASAADLGPFTCTDKSGGVTGAAATVYEIRIAHHSGYDRLVISFPTANTMPQYQLTRQATATFVRDASGQPVTLGGSAGIRAVLRNADITPGAPTDLKPGLPAIREVAQIGNFERVVSYGVGLATPACFRVLELSGPTRLVIDVQTAADAPAATVAPSAAPSQSMAASQPTAPSNLATTGHPSQPAQPSGFPMAALILGLLVLTAGLAVTGIRHFARK
ncbi:MAG: hypothetical protein QOH92_2053 [Chloroflexota bacterium]|jgi:hypothetical protein|nr:hypothetical protein [Chloroflexota bacterium]